jgi:hypothetical protein
MFDAIHGKLVYTKKDGTKYQIQDMVVHDIVKGEISHHEFFAVTPGNGDDLLVSENFDDILSVINAIEAGEAEFEDV